MEISLEKIIYEFDDFSVEIEKFKSIESQKVFYEVKSFFTRSNFSCKFSTKKEALKFTNKEIKHLKKCSINNLVKI